MDEIVDLSQLEYMNQVQTFIQHLLIAFNDHATVPAKDMDVNRQRFHTWKKK